MKKGPYKQDLKQAQQQLVKLLEQRAAMDSRIAKLRQEIGSLAVLAGGGGEATSVYRLLGDLKRELGLKGSCLEVLRASVSPLTPAEVVEGIQRLGLKPGDHANLLASVHTTLRRMTETGEAEEGTKNGHKAYRLKI